MQHFILDTNIILRNPAILAKGSEKIRFVIPEPVIFELASFELTRESGNKVLKLVRNAFAHGTIRLAPPPSKAFESSRFEDMRMPHLSGADFTIAISAEYYQKKLFPKESNSIFLATDDRPLANYAESLGIKTITSNALRDALINSPVTNQGIKRKALSVILLQRKELIFNVFFGILAGLITNLLAANIKAVFNKINIWGTILLIPVAGIFLYWLRSRYRLVYGIAEVLFGLFSSLRVFIPSFNYSQVDTTGLIQIAGGLYIMVRGMDNIGKGLKGTRLEDRWKRWFLES